jgi:hypothetical protein
MNQKKCLKCGHTATYEGLNAPLACPNCSAIYAKVEAAIRPRETASPGPASRLPSHKRPTSLDHFDFADNMRSESLYPAFRAVVGVIYWVGVVLAVLCVIGGLVASSKTNIGPGPTFAGIVLAIIIYIIFRVTKEASLMLADIADANIRMAAHQEQRDA